MGVDPVVRDAYGERAPEYVDLFGSVEAAHAEDRRLIGEWARTIDGPVLDAGCGPGHWSGYMADNGAEVEGIDLVRAFITHARARFPEVPFRVGSLRNLGVSEGRLAGILAWYSLIHLEPEDLTVVLREFARALAPGGGLLVGFFVSPELRRFPHAVTDAYSWPVGELVELLGAAGFSLVESHTRTDSGHRPHGAIVARRNRG
ncbi:class I SAM-dependent methyltransferase [Arthrobacter celericrescens]|uniref:class I SAM-dependent methyltransferase n=1 Tax=Arthrobacter celericrescens TaxID=2320851 RepID=UPI000EA06062|nr:class I SAM-dependent methyltransferase [Arthrobacter celericrescens]